MTQAWLQPAAVLWDEPVCLQQALPELSPRALLVLAKLLLAAAVPAASRSPQEEAQVFLLKAVVLVALTAEMVARRPAAQVCGLGEKPLQSSLAVQAHDAPVAWEAE